MNKDELNILEELDKIVRCESVKKQIDSIALRVERKLTEKDTASMAWEPVPLVIYGKQLPGMVHSSWIFVVRNGAITGAERHPNSRQRMMSYQGSGDIQIWNGEKWCSNYLVGDIDASLQDRWLSIPENVWHQAVVEAGNWIVLSFHTVPDNKLIEERPDPADTGLFQQRRYINT